MAKLKVVAVSTNRNSFGLRRMVMIGDNGQGWGASANDLNLHKEGEVIEVSADDIGMELAKLNFELPTQLIDPPASLVQKIWG
jgi:hypothetical protein